MMLFWLLAGCSSLVLGTHDKVYEKEVTYETISMGHTSLTERLLSEKYTTEEDRSSLLLYAYERGVKEKNPGVVLYCLREGVFPFNPSVTRDLYEMLRSGVSEIKWYLDYYERMEELHRLLDVELANCRPVNKEIIRVATEAPSYTVQTLQEAFFSYIDEDPHEKLKQFSSLKRLDLCKLLLKRQPSLNEPDGSGCTALSHAAKGGHKDVCELLIQKGANIEAVAEYGSTDLGIVAIEVTGAYNGGTALIAAAYNGHKDVCELLIQKGANIEATDKHCHTALILAAMSGCKGTCELLILKGASRTVTDKAGHTAFWHAAKKKHPQELLNLLRP